jgi:effector-binding domain-containing protein
MVATRNLLLPLAAAFVMGFGLSVVAVAQTKNAAPPAAGSVDVVPPDAGANDPFGEQVTLPELTIVYVTGSGQWDTAYETLKAAFQSINTALDKLGVKPDGLPLTIYTENDDNGFKFQAAVPVKVAPSLPPESEIKVGKSPGGPALKFVHRGSFDQVETTYEAISDHLDEKKLEPREPIIEQYAKDLATTPEDDLVIDIYVPLKAAPEVGAAK